MKGPETVKLKDGMAGLVDVTFKSIFPTQVTWMKDQQEFKPDVSRVKILNTKNSTKINIMKSQKTEAGEYNLTVANKCGSMEHKVLVEVVQKPSKPLNLQVDNVTNNSALVTWQVPEEGQPIKEYEVEVEEAKNGKWVKVGKSVVPEMELKNLKSNVEHRVRVKAFNEAGFSPFSDLSTVFVPKEKEKEKEEEEKVEEKKDEKVEQMELEEKKKEEKSEEPKPEENEVETKKPEEKKPEEKKPEEKKPEEKKPEEKKPEENKPEEKKPEEKKPEENKPEEKKPEEKKPEEKKPEEKKVEEKEKTKPEDEIKLIKELADVVVQKVVQPVTFTCEVSKEKLPAEWLKDGKAIKNSNRFKISSAGKEHSLQLLGDRLPEDEGEYLVVFKKHNLQTTAKLSIQGISQSTDH